MPSYEKVFNDEYQTRFQHEKTFKKEQLLLNGYPFSIDLQLPEGGRWLELGVGAGRVLDYHREILKRVKVFGLDYSFKALELTRKNVSTEISLIQGDIRSLPFKENSFDLVTLFGTLQVFEQLQWFRRIAQLLEFVKPGGQLGFSVHPVSVLEFLRCVKYGPVKNMTTKGFLEKGLDGLGLKGKYFIEKQHVFIVPKNLASLTGQKLPMWFGFPEFKNTRSARDLTAFFKTYLPFLTFGHWWVLIRK